MYIMSFTFSQYYVSLIRRRSVFRVPLALSSYLPWQFEFFLCQPTAPPPVDELPILPCRVHVQHLRLRSTLLW